MLSQAGRWFDLPNLTLTSDNFVPSVKISNRFFNQAQHEETVIIDTVAKTQSDLSSTSSNSYQKSSTPVATSNSQSPPLFGTSLTPPLQNFQF